MDTYFGSFFRFLLILACFAWSNEPFRVEVKDEQPNNNDILGLRMRIINNSGQQYNNVQVKYYLKKQPTDNLVLDEYYLEGLSAQLEQIDNTTAVLNVGIQILGQGTIPNADGISVGIRRSGWGSLHKENQPEYPSSEFTEAITYEVYAGDNIIAGTLSSAEAPDDILKLRFIGVRPETADTTSTWVQLQNYGNEPISLNGVKIKDASGETHSLSNLTIGAKASLRVCNGPVSSCTNDSVVTSISGLSFGKVGEFVLYQDSMPLDYIVWGARGNFADSLQVENRTIDPEQFFNTSEGPVIGPVSIYRKGDFFRAVIPNGSDSIVSWNKFRENMIDIPTSQWPFAEPLVLSDGSSVFKRDGEETVLAWIPAAGAKSYEVTVLNASDASVVYHGFTGKTKLQLPLPAGEYKWLVIPIEVDELTLSQRPVDFIVPWENIPSEFYCKYKVFVLAPSAKPEYDLEVDPLAARKDSYMLDLKWGEHIFDAEWDKPHNTSGYVDQFGNRRFNDPKHRYHDGAEGWRCWAVAIAELNHKYGGNLTQDEIIYHYTSQIKFPEDPILNAFPHGDEGSGFFNQVVRWALNIEDVENFGWKYNPEDEDNRFTFGGWELSDSVLLAALRDGYPVIIWEDSHIMLIDAAIKVSGEPYGFEGVEGYVYRFHNIDNDGTISWRTFYPSPKTFEFYVLRKPSEINRSVRMSELYEDKNGNGLMDQDEIKDADQDGLIDFDEYYRFGTYHYNWDHDTNKDGKLDFDEYCRFAAASKDYNKDYDQDGIWDKTEIISYTIREKYPEPTPYNDFGVSKEVFADIDGDGLRAEKDFDSDGDGKNDGAEDVNHNGKKDNNETDVYVKDNNQTVPPNVASVTLYARSELNYNDGVICYNENTPTGFCNIASAAEEINGDFAAKVGARATVGDIYSKGNVFLRSNTRVKGGIYLAEPSNVNNIYMQNGSTIDGGISQLSENNWNAKFMPPDYDLADYTIQSNYEFVAQSGYIYELRPGYYSSVKVEGNAKIKILPGTYYIGSIQLDSRSSVEFMEPGQETVMHVNGNFTWRATTDNKAAEYSIIAQGFKLIQHAHGQRMYIDNMVAGNIVAPYSDVVVAQARKLFYGTIFAKSISVHQYAKFYHVDFNPIPNSLVLSMSNL